MTRGQALVEAALVMPVLMFAMLVIAEFILLAGVTHGWQRSVDVLADTAAARIAADPDWRPGWDAVAAEEQERAGCGTPDVRFPDGSSEPGDRVEVVWECAYDLRLVAGASFPAATISGVAVIPAGAASPTPSPSGAP